ncbi:hypothetical protein GCK72_010548 [Caenorhabditis remanei]|uniref:Uncharacterized protein n=1 Tax=Caenorhabditis remanei TaxID=31234 RepID=A0A6A5H612_CAERE|nr:hypothetical protein GCK72_010548 [Caenorhabditis remanei]KAF1762286.1 hypothetical protein GCK72_010548 [Caenorhabditis remanei]
MEDAPEKKRRKLTTALKEAIGAHSQKPEENIEKPIALALINLLNKIQASRRPQTVLEVTLKICKEKKSEAHVEEAFLSIFRKHFAILGIDSAITCWKLIEEHLNESESLNEVTIANEFIKTSNLLGHGFGKLLQTIKSNLPSVIRKTWNHGRLADSLSIAYSLVSLILAESVYGDDQTNSESVSEYWKKEILTEKSMKKNYGMRMLSLLAGEEDLGKYFLTKTEIDDNQLQLLSEIYFNHIEFFSGILHESNCIQLLGKVIDTHLENNQLRLLKNRIRTAETSLSPILYYSIIDSFRRFFEFTNNELISIENFESLKSKEVAKQLPSICSISKKPHKMTNKNAKKLENFLDLIRHVAEKSEDHTCLAAFSILTINIAILFDDSKTWSVCKSILKNQPIDVLEKLVKAGKGLDNEATSILRETKNLTEERNEPRKFVNRSGSAVIEKLEADISVEDSITLLQGVHSSEAKKDVFDSIVKFVEDIPGGESLNELKLYKLLIEMYGGSPIESLALQIVFARIAADGWADLDRTPGTEKTDESWFLVIVKMIDLLETAMKSAKNSIIKSYTALYCQLFSQVLKNSQKFIRNSLNAVASKTLTSEMESEFVLRRHKLTQDVARLVDAMKRNESYFSMLTASIIGDAVFYGSDSLLAMSKLHSLADKNTSGLLATNLPVVERTRYKKFLSTITKASKRVY